MCNISSIYNLFFHPALCCRVGFVKLLSLVSGVEGVGLAEFSPGKSTRFSENFAIRRS